MRDNTRVRTSSAGLFLVGISLLGMTACGVSRRSAQRADTEVAVAAWPGEFQKSGFPPLMREASYPVLRVAYPTIGGAEFVNDDELCATCHKVYAETFQENVHRGIHQGQSCEGCHGPASRHLETRGKEPGTILSFKRLQPAEASELCLKCHEEDACAPGARWRTSKHAHVCLSCTSCHTGHYNVPAGTPATTEPGATAMNATGSGVKLTSHAESANRPSLRGSSDNLGAAAPNVCFQCHGNKLEMTRIAGPHQICGPNGFNCTTCHDPHGQILESSRKDLCLQCHSDGSPTMAWHSSTHALMGVACTDCHNPHPNPSVQQFVGISHYDVNRPKRLTMSVQEPEACYKCHPKIFALNALPSHHPIKEGKMVCSDCHDPHGQRNDNIKAEGLNVNQLCYKCHADKQGPFAHFHPPVTENCGICHQPHGTVANNLLRQPVVFLCLRCHTGHRMTGHPSDGSSATRPGAMVDIDRNQSIRQALYSDCTQCHAQIHGTDLPSSVPGREPAPFSR